jgi:hypothetical protein
MRIEPPPSDAPAAGTMPAATAAAAPPEEPPGVRARSHGLRVGCGQIRGAVSAFSANSGDAVLPKITKPASRKRRTISACCCGTHWRSARLPEGLATPA